ncbi:MAG: tetratricopeptide repeat protein [Armatimonadia bacterium]|nr:tetratricopeptide repeat protein [Armatimonadia bacterium]
MLGRRLAAFLAVLMGVLVLMSAPSWAQENESSAEAAALVTEGIERLNLAPSVGNFQEAVATFRQAVDVAPEYSTAHFYLGMALFNLAEEMLREDPLATAQTDPLLQEALSELQAAIDLAPSASGPRLYVARIHVQQGDLGAADDAIQGELEVAPESARPVAYEVLGRIRVAQDRLAEGMRAYNWALQADPNFAWALYSKAQLLYELDDFQQCLDVLERLDALLTAYKRDVDYLATLDAEGRRTPTQAQETSEKLRERFSRVAEFREDNMWPDVFRLEGLCLSELDQFASARAAFLAAMSERHDGNNLDLELRTLLVRQYLEQADWSIRTEGRVSDPLRLLQEVDDRVEEILEDNATYPPALQLRGEAYLLEARVYKQGDEDIHQLEDALNAFQESTAAYRSAREQGLPIPEARSGKNYAYNLAHHGLTLTLMERYQEAVDLYDEALSEDVFPDSCRNRVFKAYTLSMVDPLGQKALIEQLVDEGIERAEEAYDAYMYSGRSVKNVGTAEQEAARESGDLSGPMAMAAFATLQEAQDLFEEATRVAPGDARAYMFLADVLFQLDQLGPARLNYERALELIPPSTKVTISDERARVLVQLAKAHIQARLYEPTIRTANEALAYSSQLWEAKKLLGDAYTGLRRYEAAQEAYLNAYELLGGEANIHTAEVLAKHGHLYTIMREDQEAEMYLLRAIEMYDTVIGAQDLPFAHQPVYEQALEDLDAVQDRLTSAGPG